MSYEDELKQGVANLVSVDTRCVGHEFPSSDVIVNSEFQSLYTDVPIVRSRDIGRLPYPTETYQRLHERVDGDEYKERIIWSLRSSETARKRKIMSEGLFGLKNGSYGSNYPITPPQSPEFYSFHPLQNLPKKTTIFQPPLQMDERMKPRLEVIPERHLTDDVVDHSKIEIKSESSKIENNPTTTTTTSSAVDGNELPCAALAVDGPSTSVNEETAEKGNKSENSAKIENKEDLEKEDNRSSETVACRIFGLLSLQGPKDTKYDVSVEELHRRANSPENMNKVDLISYVRLAKNSARDLLQKHDVMKTVPNRRCTRTILSKVCEEECRELADGIDDMNRKFFPFETIAKSNILKLEGTEKCEDGDRVLKKRLQDIEIVRSCLGSLRDTIIKSRNETEVKHFELMSHNFGVRNLINQINCISKYFEIEQNLIIADLKGSKNLE